MADADEVFWYQPKNVKWDIDSVVKACTTTAHLFDDLDGLVQAVAAIEGEADIVVMSNGGFEGIHQRLLDVLAAQ